MLKSNADCMKDNYNLAARDLITLALDLGNIGHDKEMARAEGILDQLRGALHAYRRDAIDGGTG